MVLELLAAAVADVHSLSILVQALVQKRISYDIF
jgi:hypothetical protein